LSHSFKTTVSFQTSPTQINQKFDSTNNRYPQSSQQASNKNRNVQCGKGIEIFATGLIIGGSKSPRGSFPWLAAIYHYQKRFICGGSLVSNKIVITAAHCIWNKGDLVPLSPYELTVYLGKDKLHDLNEPHYISSDVYAIKNHHNWNPRDPRFDSDISAIVLTKTIQFTDYIKPICVWTSSVGHNDLRNKKGYVAGKINFHFFLR
jgi:hypothetical protein